MYQVYIICQGNNNFGRDLQRHQQSKHDLDIGRVTERKGTKVVHLC